MKLINHGVALALAVALTGIAAQAGEHRHASRDDRRAGSGMQPVAVSPQPGTPGEGWRYFSDVRHARAVVISPAGEYYYSRGAGLQLVFRPGRAA